MLHYLYEIKRLYKVIIKIETVLNDTNLVELEQIYINNNMKYANLDKFKSYVNENKLYDECFTGIKIYQSIIIFATIV